MKKKGFTLVELLAVIAILAILIIMAVPSVIKLFNKSRIDTFNNELNTIIKAAQHQYILDGEAKIYSNSSNPLRVTNNSDFNYCITVNSDGDIIDFKATNGSYKYESDGVVEETSSSDITEINGSYTIQCSPFEYVNRQNEGQITIGDEIAIDTEHFYVISSDSTNTSLLAKYNLLVGDVYNKSGSIWLFAKTLSESDDGYGLQSSNAKAYCTICANITGAVAFSGKAYWDNANCVLNDMGGTTYLGTIGLKSEYTNASNAEGTNSYASPYPHVYNKNMSGVAPQYIIYSAEWRGAQDNGYTIAYYVERYVNALKSLGAPNNISGRLLTKEEANSLSSTVKGDWSYWLGSAASAYTTFGINRGTVNLVDFWDGSSYGVRPVIVVPTNVIPN